LYALAYPKRDGKDLSRASSRPAKVLEDEGKTEENAVSEITMPLQQTNAGLET
jgi:hypothetical protein